MLSATVSRDGTDKFFKNKKYAWFPSVSAAWKIFNESFMNHQYFSMPNYPLYEGRFQMGLAWNFFD